MPATAGRVRMPANNRVHSSAALQTHGIWQSAIGYDPYAPNKDEAKGSTDHKASNADEPETENAYASFQGLLALARITGSNADEARGACKKCGRVGHLTFQCKNFLSIKEDIKEKDADAIEAAVLSGLDKIKGKSGKGNGKKGDEGEDESDEEESESSDSDVDSEMERIIAERMGKKSSSIKKPSKKKKKKEDSGSDGSDSDSAVKKKRGRSKKRSSKKRRASDSEDDDGDRRKRRKEKRRRHRDETSDEDEERRRRKRKSRKEKRRRRSHKLSDDSDSDASDDAGRHRRRKSRRAVSPSDSEVSGSDNPRIGRDAKRSEKKSRKHHREEDD